MPSSRRQKSLSKSGMGLHTSRHRRCTAATTSPCHTNDVPAAALPLLTNAATSCAGTSNLQYAPPLYSQPRQDTRQNVPKGGSSSSSNSDISSKNTPFSSSLHQSSRKHIHPTYASYQPTPPQHLAFQSRSSSGLLAATSTVEHHTHSAQPYHSNGGFSYYICQYGPSIHSSSPLTAPAALYSQAEPSSALPILPEHQHTMAYSQHHSYPHRSADYDHMHGSSPRLHSYSVHQHRTTAQSSSSSSSSAMPGSAVTGVGYPPEGRPLTAEEKELRRKVSHSAIEKRRRERTNSVLRELQSIIPGLSKSGKIQKLEILEAAAEYIRDLTTVPKPTTEADTVSSPDSVKQRGKMINCPQEQERDLDCFQSPRIPAENTAIETVLEQQQHPAVATPMSVSSNASNDDSSDDALVNNLSKVLSSSPDPSSMKIDFLICQD